jgi:hypothetical protein
MLCLAEARNVRGFVISDIFAAIKIRGIMPPAKTANLKCAKSFLGIQYSHANNSTKLLLLKRTSSILIVNSL